MQFFFWFLTPVLMILSPSTLCFQNFGCSPSVLMECSFCFRRFLSFISFHVSSDSRFFPLYYFYNLWKYSNALLWCFQLLQTCFRQKYRYCASCIGLSPRHYHLLWVRNIESPTDCSYLFSNALIWLWFLSRHSNENLLTVWLKSIATPD